MQRYAAIYADIQTIYNYRNTQKMNIKNEQHDDCANADKKFM